jgi:hypothetical protein
MDHRKINKYLIIEFLKLATKIAFTYGWLVGICDGTFGLCHTPTDEEIEAKRIQNENLKRLIEHIEK